MEYISLGRKLGIGTRVAAKILRERAQNASASAASSRASAAPATVQKPELEDPIAATKRTRQSPTLPRANVIRGVAAGGRGFGRGFWKAFSSAFGALWHQITGVFFAIFAVFFAQNVWRMRGAWWSGAEHRYFVIYLIVALLFVYFSITAFVRGHRSRG